MTRRHPSLFTLRSGQSGLGFYTTRRDAARESDLRRLMLRLMASDDSDVPAVLSAGEGAGAT
jgi:hypothetical protein